jgi:hypothetical protein
MPLAHEVAIELRKLADSIDREPNAVIIKPFISFYCDRKDEFIAVANILPRPLTKRESDSDNDRWCRIRIGYDTASITVDASLRKSLTCELVEPAKPAVYRCAPILSLEEDDALGVSNG